MPQIGPALTCNGYDPATGLCASKTVPSYVPVDQTDAYMSGQWTPGSASSSPQDASTPAAGGISDYVKGFLGFLGGNGFTGNASIASDMAGVANSGPVKAVSGAVSFAEILTDFPRLLTIILGGLFIAAGLFALAGGNKIIQVQAPNKGG